MKLILFFILTFFYVSCGPATQPKCEVNLDDCNKLEVAAPVIMDSNSETLK